MSENEQREPVRPADGAPTPREERLRRIRESGELTPGQLRTLNGRATRTENKHKRYAEEMRTAGWVAISPDTVEVLSKVSDVGDASYILIKLLSGELS